MKIDEVYEEVEKSMKKGKDKESKIDKIKNRINNLQTDGDVREVLEAISKGPKRSEGAMLKLLSKKTGEVFDSKYRMRDLEEELKEIKKIDGGVEWEDYEENWDDDYIGKSTNLLESSDLLDEILKVIKEGEDRVIGEKERCLLLYLHCFSSFCFDEPIHLKITGSSSAGKNYILKNVLKTFPDWRVVNLKRISKEFMNYVNEREDFWKGRIFVVSEGAGVEEAKEGLKLTLSRDGDGIGIVDNEGNKLEPRIIKSRAGLPAFITTTAVGIEDTELNNRLNSMGVTESKHLTEKIRNYEINKDKSPWEYEESVEYEESLQVVKHVPHHFDKISESKVVNPFSRTMSRILSTSNLNYRRNFPKVKTILKILAVLNQNRRERLDKNGKTYIIANLEDYITWYCIVKNEIAKIEYHLEGGEETFKDRLSKIKDDLPNEFTVSDVYDKEKMNDVYSRSTVGTYLYKLKNKGIIQQNPETYGKGKSNKYQIDGLDLVSDSITTSNLFFPLIEWLRYRNSEIVSKNEKQNEGYGEELEIHTPLFSELQIRYDLQSKQAKMVYNGKEVNGDRNITEYDLKMHNPTNKTIKEVIENPDILFDQNSEKDKTKNNSEKSEDLLLEDNKNLTKKLNDLNIETRKVKTSEKCCNHPNKKPIIEVPDEYKKGKWVGLCEECVKEQIEESKKYDHWSWNSAVKRCEECGKSAKIVSIYDNELKKNVNLCKECAKEMYPLIGFEESG